MGISGDWHLLEYVHLNKYSIPTKAESGSPRLKLSDLPDVAEILIMKNSIMFDNEDSQSSFFQKSLSNWSNSSNGTKRNITVRLPEITINYSHVFCIVR